MMCREKRSLPVSEQLRLFRMVEEAEKRAAESEARAAVLAALLMELHETIHLLGFSPHMAEKIRNGLATYLKEVEGLAAAAGD